MAETMEQMIERRKRVAEPILDTLRGHCDGPQEAITVLMMCVTEITARSLQTQDPHLIAQRIGEMVDAWGASLCMGEPPPKPARPN